MFWLTQDAAMRSAAVRFWLRYGASPVPKVTETRDGAKMSKFDSQSMWIVNYFILCMSTVRLEEDILIHTNLAIETATITSIATCSSEISRICNHFEAMTMVHETRGHEGDRIAAPASLPGPQVFTTIGSINHCRTLDNT